MVTNALRIVRLLDILSSKSKRIKKLKIEFGQQATKICVLEVRNKELEAELKKKPDAKCETCFGSREIPKREQPCGCVYCICEDVIQCQGCGSTMCEKHRKGGITNPLMIPCPDCQKGGK